jgi:small subunit ribosomal protein S9
MAEEKKRRKKSTAVVARGKRKCAVARVTVTHGTGKVFFNSRPLSSITNALAREILLEPLSFVSDAGSLDVRINAHGGGFMGQAQAGRTALAKALLESTKDASLKQRLLEFDRSLLVEDPRRVEPKKFKGPKARARFTKSYR